jgi:hypothetical protein
MEKIWDAGGPNLSDIKRIDITEIRTDKQAVTQTKGGLDAREEESRKEESRKESS